MRTTPCLLLLCCIAAVAQTESFVNVAEKSLPEITANDNRLPAGRLRNGVLTIGLARAASSLDLAARQGEVNLYSGLHSDWFTVQQVRLVPPLLHRFNGSRRQHRMPTDEPQVLQQSWPGPLLRGKGSGFLLRQLQRRSLGKDRAAANNVKSYEVSRESDCRVAGRRLQSPHPASCFLS